MVVKSFLTEIVRPVSTRPKIARLSFLRENGTEKWVHRPGRNVTFEPDVSADPRTRRQTFAHLAVQWRRKATHEKHTFPIVFSIECAASHTKADFQKSTALLPNASASIQTQRNTHTHTKEALPSFCASSRRIHSPLFLHIHTSKKKSRSKKAKRLE